MEGECKGILIDDFFPEGNKVRLFQKSTRLHNKDLTWKNKIAKFNCAMLRATCLPNCVCRFRSLIY